jgi:hypothetical protein
MIELIVSVLEASIPPPYGGESLLTAGKTAGEKRNVRRNN